VNILIYRLGSLGDTVIALPCFHRIAASFPDARKTLLTNSPVSEKAAPAMLVLGGSGLVHDAISYRIGMRNPAEIIDLRRRLRAERFDVLIYLTQPRNRFSILRDALFFRSCGIAAAYGLPLRKDDFYNRTDDDGMVEYEAARQARCIRSLGQVDLNDVKNWDLHLVPREIERASAALQPAAGRRLLTISMGGKTPDQDWGHDNWMAALYGIRQLFADVAFVFVGSADERERASALANGLSGPFLNLCGSVSPRECAAVFDRCALFVGHDSGPMHLAASRQVRCVALLNSRHRPRIWHPHGAGHVIFHDPHSVRRVPPQAVIESVKTLLDS
jgi:heptosyltransferase-3